MITQSNIIRRGITGRTHTFSEDNGKVKLRCQSRRRQSSWQLSGVTWWWLWSFSATIYLKKWWRRSWLWSRSRWWRWHNNKVTNNRNIKGTRRVVTIGWSQRWRLTLKIKGELIKGDICKNKITVKKRRKTFVSFLLSCKPQGNTLMWSRRKLLKTRTEIMNKTCRPENS